MENLKGKKKEYEIRKKDMITWEGCENAVRACRDIIGKTRKNVGLLLNECDGMVTGC